jgi:hypothetical protein
VGKPRERYGQEPLFSQGSREVWRLFGLHLSSWFGQTIRELDYGKETPTHQSDINRLVNNLSLLWAPTSVFPSPLDLRRGPWMMAPMCIQRVGEDKGKIWMAIFTCGDGEVRKQNSRQQTPPPKNQSK